MAKGDFLHLAEVAIYLDQVSNPEERAHGEGHPAEKVKNRILKSKANREANYARTSQNLVHRSFELENRQYQKTEKRNDNCRQKGTDKPGYFAISHQFVAQFIEVFP